MGLYLDGDEGVEVDSGDLLIHSVGIAKYTVTVP